MDFEITWTEYAADNLQAVYEYIARDNPIAAQRTIDKIVNRVETLKSIPFLGAKYSKANDPRTRELLSGKYRIFYRVIEENRQVEILMIWHSARIEPRL